MYEPGSIGGINVTADFVAADLVRRSIVSYALVVLIVDLVLPRFHILSAKDAALLMALGLFLGDTEGHDTPPFKPAELASAEFKPVPGGVDTESSSDISDDVETL